MARVTGEKTFRIATLGTLLLLMSFFVMVVVSLVAYTDRDAFISTILSDEILFSIKLSLMTATIATILAMIVAVPAAYAISQAKFRGKDIADALLDLPLVISPVALGAALLVFFNTPVGSLIEDRFIRFVFEVPGIILAQFTLVVALAVRLLKSTFDSLDPRYEQVARTLGCNKVTAFARVTLPLARNGLLAAAVLTWARAVGEFGATVTLAGATRMKTETLPVAISLNLATANVEKAVAVIFILIAISSTALFALRLMTGRRQGI
jgi:molybdate transport system permease protein